MKTPAELAQHVGELAAAFGVRLIVIADKRFAPHDAGAVEVMDGQRAVLISPVIDESTYAVALHELGHCLAPGGMLPEREFSLQYRTTKRPACLRDVKLCIEEEHAAWDWAKHYALYWNNLMDHVHRLSHNNYVKHARRYGVYIKEM